MTLLEILKSLYENLDYKRKTLLFLIILLSLLGALAELISIGALIPFLISMVSSELMPNSALVPEVLLKFLDQYQLNPIIFFAALFVFLTILSVLYRMFLVYAQLKIGNSIGHHLSVKAFESTVYSDFENHLSRKPSEVMATITVKMGQVVGNLINPIIFIFTSSVILFSIFSLLNYLYGFAVFFIFAFIFITYLLIAYWSRSTLSQNSLVISTRTDRLVSVVQETMLGFRELIIFGLQNGYLDKYKLADRELRRASVSVNLLSQIPKFILEGVATTCFVLTIMYVSFRSSNIVEIIPFIGVMALAIQRMLPLAQTIFANYATMRGNTASLSDINALFEKKQKCSEVKKEEFRISFQYELNLKSIKYSYPLRKQEVLDGINLKIVRGQTIGFFGETASGKSTLVDIISGLLKPTSGHIFLDGNKTTLSNQVNWFRNVSIVSQNPFLLDDTIERNITLSLNAETQNSTKIQEAIAVAELSNDLDRMSDGINTIVGQNGADLSGGQRQRIALARAIYKQYQILILDEATSALDLTTEKKIINNINNLTMKPTVIMIAHRLSTLSNCDIIHEIKNGLVTRSGSYKQLFG